MTVFRSVFKSILFLSVLFPSAVRAAACLSSQIGILKWQADGVTNSVQYCDGFNWQSTDHGSTGVSCAQTAGYTTYSGGIYQFCGNADGKWHTMKGTSSGACSVAGQAWFNGMDWVFCDGTTLYSMNPNLACAVKLTTTGAGTWTVPTSFTTPNMIKVIGGGGGSGGSDNTNGGSGGGGGAYNSISNVTLLTSTVKYFVGAGGTAGGSGTGSTGGAGGDTYFCVDNTATAGACDSINGSKVLAGAKGGSGGTYSTGGAGGDATLNKPATGFSGGAGAAQGGAFNPANTGGGGGGAAGPSGVGLAASKNAGGKGDNGGTAANTAGTSWGNSAGPGGGASGGANGGNGVAGPIYGAGAGGAGKGNNTGAVGGQGLIYITWTSTLGNCN